MFKAKPRGCLLVNGNQVDNKGLAQVVGASVDEITDLIKILEENNVFSRLEDGTIICRRMYNEWKARKRLTEGKQIAGKVGATKRWKNKTRDPNIGTIYVVLAEKWYDCYEETMSQPYPTSAHANKEINMMKNLYAQFNNPMLWAKHSQTQLAHTLQIVEMFFKVGPQRGWAITPENLLNKASRLQLILTKGTDGTWKKEEGLSGDDVVVSRKFRGVDEIKKE
jgi:hypothetical protein